MVKSPVMMAEPLDKALRAARQRQRSCGVQEPKVVYFTPQGRVLDHALVLELGRREGLILLAGRYVGIDERLIARAVEQEISVGDYVVSGGELPAMMLMDSIIRHLPGALGDPDSARQESFVSGMLDYPQYTRPREFRGMSVPDVLLSGNHPAIAQWRQQQRKLQTQQRRPDLWDEYEKKAHA